MRSLFLTGLLTLAFAAPAAASTVPRVDFRNKQSFVSVGVLDASVDTALNDRMSVGLSLAAPLSYAVGAGRLTYRLGEANGLTYGVTLSAGVTGLTYSIPGVTMGPAMWVQPAFNAAWPLPIAVAGKGNPLTLRGTVGPVFATYQTMIPSFFLVPSLELAYRYDPKSELTLGGNSVIGWRGTF